jgi:hypothetical protein
MSAFDRILLDSPATRRIISVPVPELDAVVDIVGSVSGNETTVICFKGPLVNNFTLKITKGRPHIGDQLIIITPKNSTAVVSLSGDIQFMECGGALDHIDMDSGIRQVFPHYFDGTTFTGIDNC